MTFWFSEDVIRQWDHGNVQPRRGHPFVYSDTAAAKLGISLDVRRHTGAIDVVADSTGLKVFGEGEWKMRKHGKSKRRTWRKLH